jgi:uncharacterized protein involved in outer membrane biogenesis
MLTMKKVILLAVGLAIVVFAAILLYVYSSLNSIVKSAIEAHGSRITGVAVGVSDVEISLQTGEGTVRGLRIANPEGFSQEAMFSLDEAKLDLDLGSIGGSPIVIQQILVDALHVRVERNSQGETNLEKLQENLSDKRSKDADQDPREPGEELRLRIDDFKFLEAQVTGVGFEEEERTITAPDIRMQDVGGQQGGTGEEVGRAILAELVRSSGKALAIGGAEKLLDEKLGDKAEPVKELMRSILQ